MRLDACIPARGGSKSIPKKNLVDVMGHPLIAYSIVAAQSCENIERVIVSTDCDEVASAAKKYGAEVPFCRPSEYAQDKSTDWEVFNHYFQEIEGDDVVFLRPTSPLRNPHQMSAIISSYSTLSNSCTGMRSMHSHTQPPYKMFQVNDDGFAVGFFNDYEGEKEYTGLPRQHFPRSYVPNGYLDVVKRKTIEEGTSCFGTRIRPVITETTIDVDTHSDLHFLEFELQTHGHLLLDILEDG